MNEPNLNDLKKMTEETEEFAHAIARRIGGYCGAQFPNGRERPRDLRRQLYGHALEAQDWLGRLNVFLRAAGRPEVEALHVPQSFDLFLLRYPGRARKPRARKPDLILDNGTKVYMPVDKKTDQR